jgi:hypothetical protein
MKAHELIQRLPEQFSGDLFQFLHASDKPAYKACMQILGSRRKLRPIILERKSRDERHSWMRNELTRKSNEDAATEILQTWLFGAHQAMICEFLDALKIAHNGHGLVETLPPQPPEEDLRAAVEGLVKNHPATAVSTYLYLFIEMDIADWPALKDILDSDARLSLAQPTAS